MLLAILAAATLLALQSAGPIGCPIESGIIFLPDALASSVCFLTYRKTFPPPGSSLDVSTTLLPPYLFLGNCMIVYVLFLYTWILTYYRGKSITGKFEDYILSGAETPINFKALDRVILVASIRFNLAITTSSFSPKTRYFS